ncbi:hypothetical protein [Solilutibacter tolerans]|uniref:hypothetical protein n=1 Tax=Solilutibacter tolerans TaxID=1604334 RepID=UPI000970A06B|nr:hypothetical protein [Lysobacter tolerans]
MRETLRDAREPLSSRDIAIAILALRGLEHDATALKEACVGVSRTLWSMESVGQALKVDARGKNTLWEKR